MATAASITDSVTASAWCPDNGHCEEGRQGRGVGRKRKLNGTYRKSIVVESAPALIFNGEGQYFRARRVRVREDSGGSYRRPATKGVEASVVCGCREGDWAGFGVL